MTIRMTLPRPLIDAVAANRLIPFIGAGFSRIFHLPDWSELIDQIADHTGFDPEVARLYGDFLQLAEYLYIHHNGLSKVTGGFGSSDRFLDELSGSAGLVDYPCSVSSSIVPM